MGSKNKNTDTQPSAIDRALAEAKRRKAARAALNNEGTLTQDEPVTNGVKAKVVAKKAAKVKAEKPTDEAKAAAKAARDAERAAKRAAAEVTAAARKEASAARKAEKAAARQAKLAAKPPAHMKKVERARAKLPRMSTSTELAFNELIGSLSALDLTVLSLHLQLHNRAAATIRANTLPRLEVGQTVTITGGDPKFVGMTGTVAHANKLRAKIDVPGQKKLVYIFNGEAEPVAGESRAAANG